MSGCIQPVLTDHGLSETAPPVIVDYRHESDSNVRGRPPPSAPTVVVAMQPDLPVLHPPRAQFLGTVSFVTQAEGEPLPLQSLPPVSSSLLQDPERDWPPLDDPSWTFQAETVLPSMKQWIPVERIEEQATHWRLLDGRTPVALSIPNLIVRALQHSIKQKQLEIRPAETRQLISVEYGVFDPAAFVASQFDVQNLQQTQEDNRVAFGLRKKHQYGGSLEMNETLGVQDRLAPFALSDQGIATLNIIYTQELLRDGGKDVALGRGLIASYQYDQSFAKSAADSNDLIQRTVEAYWQLYRARANYFIQYALIEVAEGLLLQIEDRSQLVERSLNSLEQARALLLEAKADLVDAQTRVLQAQDVLYRLVNDPGLDPKSFELITAEGPASSIVSLEPMQELSLAFENRPEVKERIAAIRENAVALHLSLNQLLPRLSVALRSSLNGFDDDRNYVGALSRLSDRPPSGAAIANLEMFLNNRTARAKNKEAQLRATRLVLEYEDQLQAIREQVLVNLRAINNASPEIQLRTETLQTREREIDAITTRIWVNPEEGVSMVLQLDQLFQAINRLVRTQQQLIEAKVDLQTSLVALQRAKGELVNPTVIPPNQSVPIPRPIHALGEQVREKPLFKEEIRDRVIREPLPR